MTDDPLYQPLSPGYRADPYPYLRRLREEDPVHWSAPAYCWVLTRYDDIKYLLSDRRFGIGMDRMLQNPYLMGVLYEPYNVIIRTQILAADPPDHPRIRALLSRPFTGQGVEALRPLVQREVDRLIDAVAPAGRMDFMADFAQKLPAVVISEILNIPPDARPVLVAYDHDLMRTTDPTPMGPEETFRANQAAIGFREYFLDLARRRRAAPTPDLFSEVVAALDRGEITEEEFVANMILTFCAGHDTVLNMLGNSMLALHRHPDQLKLLREDPSLWRNAVEELLRFDTPLQIARRMAFADVPLGGKEIHDGDYVLCMLGGANRDPAVYPEPDRLDIRRRNIRPQSFGGGIHHCLGALLARVEGEIGLSTLMRRLPDLTLETLEPAFKQNVFIRGPVSLPATFTPAPV